MSEHSVAEARDNLSKLIERALNGEAVVITRHGKPLIEFKPVQAPPRQMTEADIQRLRANRVTLKPGADDAVTLLRKMRDEDWR
jgi:antitoxin (DNA-binding transcriptional repressor) of toxin-antitoxin stability system